MVKEADIELRSVSKTNKLKLLTVGLIIVITLLCVKTYEQGVFVGMQKICGNKTIGFTEDGEYVCFTKNDIVTEQPRINFEVLE